MKTFLQALFTTSLFTAFYFSALAETGLPTDSIFAPTSFWYTPIPTNVTLHTNSANFVTEFLRQKTAYYGTVNVNTHSYCSPVFIANASTPKVKVNWLDCQNKGGSGDPNLLSQWTSVPIPTGAAPSAGTDQEMCIYDPVTHAIWEFWVCQKNGSQWVACWGGGMQKANTNQGIWPNPYGTTATGLPFLGGQVTAEELKRGEIRHAIGIALVDLANWNVVSWPATRSDGSNPNNAANRIAEGQRFRLDPTINVDLLNMHPVGKIIAKAAQKYGFVVWDKAGSISIRAQNASSYTALGQVDPYTALYNGTAEYALLNNFPWDKLQFLPMNYGKNITTGISTDETASNSVNIYPNPFTTNFTVTIPSEIIIKDAVMKIYDLCGREVKTVLINTNETNISSDELQSGIYFYQIINNDETIFKGKLMVQ